MALWCLAWGLIVLTLARVMNYLGRTDGKYECWCWTSNESLNFFFCFFLFLFLMYINYLNCRSSLSWPLQSLGDPVQPVLLWQSFINWIIFLFWTLLFFLFVSCLEYIMPLKPICGHQGHEHSCSWFFCWGFEMSPLAPKARLRPS